jgi:hypothetical protein
MAMIIIHEGLLLSLPSMAQRSPYEGLRFRCSRKTLLFLKHRNVARLISKTRKYIRAVIATICISLTTKNGLL